MVLFSHSVMEAFIPRPPSLGPEFLHLLPIPLHPHLHPLPRPHPQERSPQVPTFHNPFQPQLCLRSTSQTECFPLMDSPANLQPWGLWGQDLSLPGLSPESKLSTHHLCPALHQNTNPPLPQCEVSLLTFPHIGHTWAPASYLIF